MNEGTPLSLKDSITPLWRSRRLWRNQGFASGACFGASAIALVTMFIILQFQPRCNKQQERIGVPPWGRAWLGTQIMIAESALHRASGWNTPIVCLPVSRLNTSDAQASGGTLNQVFDIPPDGCLRNLTRLPVKSCCYDGDDYSYTYGAKCQVSLAERIRVGQANLKPLPCGNRYDMGDALVLHLRTADLRAVGSNLRYLPPPCAFYTRIASFGSNGSMFDRVVALTEPNQSHVCLPSLRKALGAPRAAATCSTSHALPMCCSVFLRQLLLSTQRHREQARASVRHVVC